MADLGTINSAIDNLTGATVQSFSGKYITTTIINSSVLGVDGILVTAPAPTVYTVKGDDSIPSLLAAEKANSFPTTSLGVHVAQIQVIVPGPIANITYGIRIGRDLERIEVPRVYPAIYINPRSRNA